MEVDFTGTLTEYFSVEGKVHLEARHS